MRALTCRVLCQLVALVTAAAAAAAPVPQTVELTLLHTSDVHGHVLPFDDARNRPANGSLAQVATLVDRLRAAAGHPVLVLDSGDTIQGTPLEEFAHVRWGEPSPTIAAMNRIGYQAMAVGNHEFNFGLDVLRSAQQQAHFPFLSANTVRAGTDEPAFRPYVVLQAGPLRVGVLGLTTPRIPGWEMPEHYPGLAFQPMDEAARRWVPVLRGKEHCDLVVVLAHTGFERDPDSGESNGTEEENFAWRLTRVPGIDVLLTGHAHQDIPPRLLNGVIASEPSSRARRLTRIDLALKRDETGWAVARWTGENLPTEEVPADAKIMAADAALHERVVAALDGPVGHTERAVTVHGCRLGDCAAMDLVHAAQLAASGADLSLASLLTDGTPDLEPGPITWRWVYALYVYPNTLVAVRLTGAQVKDVLEYAARYYDGLECDGNAGCTVLVDPHVRHYNVDSLEGLSYRIDPTRPEGDRVRELTYHGAFVDLHASFTLVCNNYRAAGGGGYPHLKDAPVVWKSSEEMTGLIGDYLALHNPWSATTDGNWWIAPDIVAERPCQVAKEEDKVAP